MKFKTAPESIELNYTLNRVMDILGDKNDESINNISDSNNKITDILKVSKNKNNVDLAAFLIGEVDFKWFNSFETSNKNIALMGVKASSQNYRYLTSEFKKDEDVAKIMIKTYLREGDDFFTVREFITSNFDEKTSKKLLKEYGVHLEKYSNLVGDDLSKILLDLQDKDEKLLKVLKNLKIITKNSKIHVINPSFVKNFNYEILNDKGYKDLSKEDKNILKKNKLIQILGLNELSENVEYIINLIINLSFLEEDKLNITKKSSDEKIEKDENTKENDTKKEKIDISGNSDIFDDRMEYNLPNYNYSYSGSYCNIHTNENIDIKISKSEKQQFTSEALEKFVEFYKTLYSLGLSFFWDKYNSSFKELLGFKGIDFNYTSGQGITEGKTLQILNLIGKNIGVPEHEILVNNGDTKTEIRCFKTIGDAKIQFAGIKSSSTINGKPIETNMSIGAVEKKLFIDDKLDFAKGTLNIASWL